MNIEDIEKRQYHLKDYPVLVRSYVVTQSGLESLESWRSSKTNITVFIFLVVMILGTIFKLYSTLNKNKK